MEVERLSKEAIKPSSPTPHHLQVFKISLLDKLFHPSTYVSMILFYPKHHHHNTLTQISHQHLKKSLSETLTRYYPIAGRLNADHATIDCNDKGVPFTTARVNGCLTDLLREPQVDKFVGFVPHFWQWEPEEVGVQLAVQFNEFACGGLAISVCFSHAIMDMTAMATFLQCWAGVTKHGATATTIYPDFAGSKLFSVEKALPNENVSFFSHEMSCLRQGNGTTRRFSFSDKAIADLRALAASEKVGSPTRVEAVSCFLWKHLMATSRVVWGSNDPSMMSFAVDLRRRMEPPLLKTCVGNIIWKLTAHCESQDLELDGIVGILRKGLEEMKESVYIENVLRQGGHEAVCERFDHKGLVEDDGGGGHKNVNPFVFTSWCRSGLNEVDFGWGKPVWVSSIGFSTLPWQAKNQIVLMDGPMGKGIDAWVMLDQRDMDLLEKDADFLAFASPNPPVFVDQLVA